MDCAGRMLQSTPSRTFQSESPNPDPNLYAVIGHEQNGVFFHLEADDE